MTPHVKDVERFWSYVLVHPIDGCWIWAGAINGNGYGAISIGGRAANMTPAHRFAYELLVGPIPEGLTLDHLCRVRRCVNPDHLEPVTRGENVRRGMSPAAIAARTGRCARGHAEWRPNGPKARTCAVCARERERTRRLCAAQR